MSAIHKIKGAIVTLAAAGVLTSMSFLHAATTPSSDRKAKSQYLLNSSLKQSSKNKYLMSAYLFDQAWKLDSTDTYMRYLRGKDAEEVGNFSELMRPYYEAHPDDEYIAVPYIARLFMEEKSDDAISAMERLVEVRPENMQLRQLQFELFKELGNREKAEEVIKTMQMLGLTDEDGLALRMNLLQNEEELDTLAVENLLKDFLAQHPDSPDVKETLTGVYFFRGKKDEAFTLANEIVKDNPDNFSSYMVLADMYIQSDDIAKGKEIIEKALATSNADSMGIMNYIYYQENDSLTPLVEKIIAANPTDELLGNYIARSYMAGQYGKVDSVLTAHPDMKFINELVAEAAMLSEFMNDKPQKILDIYDKAIADGIGNKDTFANRRLGAYAMMNDEKKFLSLRDSLLASCLPGLTDYNNLTPRLYTTIYERTGDAINVYLMEAEMFNRIGGQPEKVMQASRNALMLNPDNAESLNNYAYFLSENSSDPAELEEALEMSKKSIAISPDINKFDTLAWLLFKLGRCEEAREIMELLIAGLNETISNRGDFYDHLGDIYALCGESEKALEMWEKALTDGAANKNLPLKIEKGKSKN